MRIEKARSLVLVAAGLSLLAGCASSTLFDEAATPNRPAQAAANSDVTSSIPMRPSAQPAAQAQFAPPAAALVILLGVGY